MPNITSQTPIKIIKAVNGNGADITSKLNMFINFKWDENMFTNHGGIDLDVFFKYIGSSVVWIAYVLDYEIDNTTCMQFMDLLEQIPNKSDSETEVESIQGEDNTVDYFKKCIRIIVINAGLKIMHKLNKHSADIDVEDVAFGEVNFY